MSEAANQPEQPEDVGDGVPPAEEAAADAFRDDAEAMPTEYPSAADAVAPRSGPAPIDGDPLTVEGLVDDLERTSRERDGYLDAWRRTQADFENYKKRVTKQQADAAERAAESLVDKVLPVLDACDGAVRHGEDAVTPIYASLLGVLEKEGLERIDPGGDLFDPNRHEAVMHEPADDDSHETVVADVMRPGYAWKGRLLRPAMVKVKG
jgi:molecular chaperone GrpE